MTLTSPKALLDVSRPSSIRHQQFRKYPFATKLNGFVQISRTSNHRRLGFLPFPSIRETCYILKRREGKKGIWLKILLHQSHLIPIAIQEGFDYHHAEMGYVMLTYWIPDDLCTLPASPSHQIGSRDL